MISAIIINIIQVSMTKILKRIKSIQATAMFTVEISLIIALILGVVFLEIFFAFFLHDKVIMESLLTRAAISTTAIDERELIQQAETMTICLQDIQFSCQEGIFEDRISYSAQVTIPLYGWIRMLIAQSEVRISGYRERYTLLIADGK